ncbi:hypothetical protein BGZ83_004582 [Gryganskiella cystojenkinii]|nr:hypothetical protein BGZ83_004582 [Gryganskiella cystojenkinii]
MQIMSLSSDPTYWSTPSSSQNTSSQDQHAFRSTSPSNAHLTFATAAHPYPSSSSSISRLSVATGTASAAAGAIKKLWRRQRDISASPNPNEKSFSLNNNSKSGQQHQHWQAALLSVGPLPTITSSEGLISPPPSPPDSQSPPTSPTISTWTRCTLTPLVKLERGVYRPSPELLSRSRFSSSEALRGDMGSGGSIGDAGESPLSINSNGNSIFSHSRRSMSVDSTKSTLSILHGVPCGLPHPILVPSRTPFQYDTDNEDNNDDDDDEFRPCPSSLSSIVQLTSPISRSMSPIDNSNDDQNSHTNGSLNSATTVTVTITTEEIAHLGLMRGATTPASSSSEHLKESDPDTKANLIPEEPTFQMNLFAPPDKARITTAHDDEKDAEIGFMRASVQFLNTHHHLSDGRALQRQRSLRGLNSESNSQPSSGGGGDLRRSADVRRKHRTAIYGLGLSHSFPSFETGGALEQEGLLPSPSFAIKTATTTPPTNAPQSITTRLAAPSPSALTTYTCSRTQSYNCPKARLMIRTCMSADERFEEMLKEGFQSSDPSLPSPQCLSPTSVAFSDSAIEFNGECDLSDFDPSAASGAPFEVHPAGIRYMTLRLTLTPWHARADETQLYGSEPVLVPSQPSTTALTASPSSSKAIYKGNNNNEMSD